VKLILSQRDNVQTSLLNPQYNFVCELDYENENITMKVVSELKVQNRTLGASGGTTTDDVANNPLQGKLYQFNHAIPRYRNSDVGIGGYQLARNFDTTGAITVRAAELYESTKLPTGVSSNFTWNEPPNYQIFSNVKKHGKVLLQPAEIKKDVLVFTMTRQCHVFFEDLNWKPTQASFNNNANTQTSRSRGKCSLIALEDVINVNSLQLIKIAYEINRTEAMYMSTKKDSPSQGNFTALGQSSNPA